MNPESYLKKLTMDRYYPSGLRDDPRQEEVYPYFEPYKLTPFFTRVPRSAFPDFEHLIVDEESFKDYYNVIETEEDKAKTADFLVKRTIEMRARAVNVFYRPLECSTDLAYECGLIPLLFEKRTKILIGGNCAQLEAYQALVDGTIDRLSDFFRYNNYFEHFLGEELAWRIKVRLGLVSRHDVPASKR